MIDTYTRNNGHNVIMGPISSGILLWLLYNNNPITSLIMVSLLLACHNVFSPVKIVHYYIIIVFAGLELFVLSSTSLVCCSVRKYMEDMVRPMLMAAYQGNQQTPPRNASGCTTTEPTVEEID